MALEQEAVVRSGRSSQNVVALGTLENAFLYYLSVVT